MSELVATQAESAVQPTLGKNKEARAPELESAELQILRLQSELAEAKSKLNNEKVSVPKSELAKAKSKSNNEKVSVQKKVIVSSGPKEGSSTSSKKANGFDKYNLPEQLINELRKLDFHIPTPIQEGTIPHARAGKDILGSAQTGSGKTAAYGIPLIVYLMLNKHNNALILLPTRELAQQVVDAIHQLSGDRSIKTCLLIGGAPMWRQLNNLKRNPRIIIGTPGRINDHLRRKTLSLAKTGFLVLDEVDRMLDMGFGVQLDEISKYLTAPKRQTLMFSATMPRNIEKLSARYLTDPIRVAVDSDNTPAQNIKQNLIKLKSHDKYTRLQEELNSRTCTILVFVSTKRSADRIAKDLDKDGHKADCIHGDLKQSKRTKVISSFRKKQFRILIATDVAARGLDISHIELVINYDLPQRAEDYIHRIGRTGRAGKSGEALNFLSPQDNLKWRDIQFLLNPEEAKKQFVRHNNSSSKRTSKPRPQSDGNKSKSWTSGNTKSGRSFNKNTNQNGEGNKKHSKARKVSSFKKDKKQAS